MSQQVRLHIDTGKPCQLSILSIKDVRVFMFFKWHNVDSVLPVLSGD